MAFLPLPPECIGLKFFNVVGQSEYHQGDMMSVVAKNHDVAATTCASLFAIVGVTLPHDTIQLPQSLKGWKITSYWAEIRTSESACAKQRRGRAATDKDASRHSTEKSWRLVHCSHSW